MSVEVQQLFEFDNSFVRDLQGLYEPWQAEPVPSPKLLALNAELANELGVNPDALKRPDGIAVLVGNRTPPGAVPVAQAYAGHQFGGYSPRLGDGRALLVGEVLDSYGRRRDLHLKGSGRTPFARGGDGKAAVGPMLREYLIGEAMHSLGVPTTRGLAVVGTGEQVARDSLLPGAVLTRVAASHLRVGTFQFAAAQGSPDLLRRLADYSIARHYPGAVGADNRYLRFFEYVVDAQASLVARWMLVGFIHGVMNTDNMAISGESIDFGPCAFMDTFEPATVFSSIDHGGRYAYGNQPPVAQWNLARLAESLLTLIDTDTDTAVEAATEVLKSFPERYHRYWGEGMRAKLGFERCHPGDEELMEDLLELLRSQQVDFTRFFRALSISLLQGDQHVRSLLVDPSAFDAWGTRWQEMVTDQGRERQEIVTSMNRVNPVYIPRNHLVEEALTAASESDDLGPFEKLLDVLHQPFERQPGLDRYAEPAPSTFGPYRTFCGT